MKTASSQFAPSLPFGEPEYVPPVTGNVRQKAIDAALKKARDAWRVRYTAFVLEFAKNAQDPFTAEDVRESYLSTPGVPKTDHEQASGGIFQRLSRDGSLEMAGMKRSRKFGNKLQAYIYGGKSK